MEEKKVQSNKPSIFTLLKQYQGMIIFLVILALLSNILTLILPKVISHSIDAFVRGNFIYKTAIIEFIVLAFGILILTFLQNIIQTYASEKVALNLRTDLAAKVSRSSHLFIQKSNPSTLLTYLTSDVDSVKMFVAQAVSSLISSVVIIFGASIMLVTINWRLGLAVMAIIPIIAFTFFTILSKVRVLFVKSREIIDWLNKVINESILGALLIRVINSKNLEHQKFDQANSNARTLGLKILGYFSLMIPIITFVANLGTLIILTLGGHFVINGSMSIGDFTAFNSYVAILIFPIFIIGFMMNIISQAQASYARISNVLTAPEILDGGNTKKEIKGEIEVKDVSINYGEKAALKHVSFSVKAGTRTAIIGPTAAGKSQLLYLLTGLTVPDSGVVEYDHLPVEEYDSENLHRQIGFVFQDSIMFNLSIRENIAFSDTVTDKSLQGAIDTAELQDFLGSLPEGLNTIVSERGSSLSGGQKQRIMLARALALDPKVLLLDDFTARVDTSTEQRILANITKNYPNITLVSVTQKISSVEDYDEIILLMEGEVLAKGTHAELMESSAEYVQIYNSQRSTSHYELQA
ncbi:MAG: ABC transporter ATP-binding protein [Candidatus Pacebacteria bacterium]|nr:ABC transporter ATP-binding protein [Candidatus Paceibacterota bacterium]